MRPRFSSAIADRAARATADLSRWTHRVGVTGRARDKSTPTSPPGRHAHRPRNLYQGWGLPGTFTRNV